MAAQHKVPLLPQIFATLQQTACHRCTARVHDACARLPALLPAQCSKSAVRRASLRRCALSSTPLLRRQHKWSLRCFGCAQDCLRCFSCLLRARVGGAWAQMVEVGVSIDVDFSWSCCSIGIAHISAFTLGSQLGALRTLRALLLAHGTLLLLLLLLHGGDELSQSCFARLGELHGVERNERRRCVGNTSSARRRSNASSSGSRCHDSCCHRSADRCRTRRCLALLAPCVFHLDVGRLLNFCFALQRRELETGASEQSDILF